jgi:hypothetical protein
MSTEQRFEVRGPTSHPRVEELVTDAACGVVFAAQFVFSLVTAMTSLLARLTQ